MGNSFIRKIVGWELGLIGYQIIRNKKEPLTEEDKKRLVDNTFIALKLRIPPITQKKTTIKIGNTILVNLLFFSFLGGLL